MSGWSLWENWWEHCVHNIWFYPACFQLGCIAHLHSGCLTSLNFSSRINAGGAEGSPCRFYLKRAKSISTDRDTMQGALHISLAYKLLPLIFPLTVSSTEIARLSGAADGWQTDRRYPSKLAITEGGCRQRRRWSTGKLMVWLMQSKLLLLPCPCVCPCMWTQQRSDAGLESISTANIITTSAWLFSDRCVLTGRLVYRLKLD